MADKKKRRSTRGAVREPGAVDALQRWVAEKGITKAKVGGIDIDGVWRGKYISLDKLYSAARGGLGFCDVVFGWDLQDALYDNAEVTGWHTGYPDADARLDVATGRVIPWEPDTAAFLLDFVNRDGSSYEPSPRQLLQKIARRARDMGFRPKFGAEYEYFIFKETPQSLHQKGFRELTPLTPGMFGYSWIRTSANASLVHAIIDGCNAFGIDVEGMHTETGPGVYESAIRYDDLEVAADRAALFKTVVKEICAKHGYVACFMAKVSQKLPGCSGHIHESLWNLAGTKNLFADEGDTKQGANATLRHYLGGQIALMPELTSFYWPTINSYKRSVENTWAPTHATWGHENRTCSLRVIGSGKAKRVEYRQTGADMNAYIGMAVSLAAGLWGIENEVEPPAPVKGNAYRSQAAPLPRSLKDAVEATRRSNRVRGLLGDGFVDHYLRTRDWEVRQAEQAVTTWELERYLELI